MIPGWILFVVPTVLTGAMLLLNYFAMRQKMDERSLTIYREMMQTQVHQLEADIDSLKVKVIELTEALGHSKQELLLLQREIVTLRAENLALLQRMFQNPQQEFRRNEPGGSG